MRKDTFYKLILSLFLIIVLSLFINYNLYLKFNKYIWFVAIIMLFGGGIFFSYKLNFLQLRIFKIIKYLFKNKNSKGDISTLESVSMTLAAQIGVGSIAGVSLAIYIGGPGTIFWMWISGIITSINSYVESVLGVIFQEKDYNKVYKGGPSYYIKKGLGNNKLAYLYAFLIIVSYIIGFITIQSNTIVNVTSTYVNKYLVLVILSIISSYIIFKDVKSIAKFSSIIVPIMGLIYLFIGMFILYNNIDKLGSMLTLIISSAFNIKSGIIGFITPIIIGIQRGIFACESGIGTSAIASSTTNEKPKKEGYIQTLGVYFTILVICTITAFIILLSDYQTLNIISPNGIEITSHAFNYHLGSVGKYILCLVTILFAYSTIISGYYYGESSLKFLIKGCPKTILFTFKLLTIILLFIGGLIRPSFIWNIVDTLVAFLAIINMCSIYKLFRYGKKEYNDN